MKKLVLKKDVVANLNDYHMNHLRGGATPAIYSAIVASVGSIAASYDLTKEWTVWGDTCRGTCKQDASCADTCQETCAHSCGGTCTPSCNGTCGVSCAGVCNSFGC